MKDIIIRAIDGYLLSALYGTPEKSSSPSVIIGPATGIKKEFYFHFANYLIQQGYSVLIFDYRGIGGSAPEDLRTSPDFLHDWGLLDMNAALNYMIFIQNQKDIIWLGHSIGGQLIGLLDHREYIKKFITINAALGYWGYFPQPWKFLVWCLWKIIHPVMTRWYGFGNMKLIGWGENLPPQVLGEWKEWCTNKNYFQGYLETSGHLNRYLSFSIPIIAIYMSDDYIANDKTAPLMQHFFPKAAYQIHKIQVEKYTPYSVGHTGIFRRRFEYTLWPILLDLIIGQETESTLKKTDHPLKLKTCGLQ